jgi:hypothetical protein
VDEEEQHPEDSQSLRLEPPARWNGEEPPNVPNHHARHGESAQEIEIGFPGPGLRNLNLRSRSAENIHRVTFVQRGSSFQG